MVRVKWFRWEAMKQPVWLLEFFRRTKYSRVFRNNKSVNSQRAYSASLYFASEDTHAIMSVAYDSGVVGVLARNTSGSSSTSTFNTLYGTANTTRASDGTLKAASPVVKIFMNGECHTNDESEMVSPGVAVERRTLVNNLVSSRRRCLRSPVRQVV